MTVFTVDTDAVISRSSAVRATSDRIHADTQAMHAQLAGLQSSWTGGASAAFQQAVEQWRVAQRGIEEALNSIALALGTAGRHYLEAEQATAAMFR